MSEIMALKNAPVEELLRRYKELYGEDGKTRKEKD